jgi:4-hydroxy 2-oxovalerate aldolase
MKIKILDCTLRDGGYINNWAFLDKQIIKILDALDNSKINTIECGYFNDKKGKQKDSTLFDSVDTANKVLNNIKSSSIQKVVMINLGDFDIANLTNKEQTNIDGIRLAFHKKDIAVAFESAKRIINLGYKLYFQPMITKNYKDIEFLSIIEQVNELKPYAFYIVDSFGSMTLDEFNKYLILAHNNLVPNIFLGYHSHNNMQLAFSNAISMCTQNLNRKIIIDASIYGIGRGAGNLNTELIADYLNKSFGKNYETLPLLEVIDELLASLMSKTSWGFSPAQFLSASYNCHPNYATYLVNKNTNYIVGIKKVLDKLPEEKKSSFDKELIEKLYRDFVLEARSSVEGKLVIPINKKVLLVASGKSVTDYHEILNQKLKEEGYIVIGLNHKPTLECDYYFFTNQKRYDEFRDNLDDTKLVVTNNINVLSKPFAILDFSELILNGDVIVTNSTILAINYLIQIGQKDVDIAGLDGYKAGIENYSYDENQIVTDNKILQEENNIIKTSLKKLANNIKIRLITPSIFKGNKI